MGAYLHAIIERLEELNPRPAPTEHIDEITGERRLLYSTIAILCSKHTRLGLRDCLACHSCPPCSPALSSPLANNNQITGERRLLYSTNIATTIAILCCKRTKLGLRDNRPTSPFPALAPTLSSPPTSPQHADHGRVAAALQHHRHPRLQVHQAGPQKLSYLSFTVPTSDLSALPLPSNIQITGEWRLLYSTIAILGCKCTKLGLRNYHGRVAAALQHHRHPRLQVHQAGPQKLSYLSFTVPTSDLSALPLPSNIQITGEWRLLYSTIAILGSKRTKLGLRDFISLGDFLQIVDKDTRRAANMVEFAVRGLGLLSGKLTIEAMCFVFPSPLPPCIVVTHGFGRAAGLEKAFSKRAANVVEFSVRGLGLLSGKLTIEATYTVASPTSSLPPVICPSHPSQNPAPPEYPFSLLSLLQRVDIKFESSSIVPDQVGFLLNKLFEKNYDLLLRMI
ncbi:unnamed protein product [Closterium sp. NIES-64]|nr:unnamed protein product [Closterium sp. NIES-64]